MEGESAFEYDEDVEGDESYEASDEGDESYEADEASDEGDESYEADEADESFEASDEADESDEAYGEADGEADEADESASTELRAEQARRRQSAFAQKLATDQRREAERAASTQRSITNQIRAIQPGPGAKVASVGSLQGAGVVTAVLPNGRRSRMRIIPTLAPVKEVNRLRSVVMVNERRQAIATRRNARAITALGSTQAAAVKRLTAQQVQSDKDLSKRVVETYNRLDKRITKELSGRSGVVGKHDTKMMRALKRHRQRTLWNNVLLATSAPFFAAYGETGNPFAKNNLILTGSLLGWLFGDEVIDQFSGKSSFLKGGANLWSYLAFAGNGATAYFLLNNKQHERFVSGVTAVAATTGVAKVELTKSQIASGSADDFKTKRHTVMATFLDPAEGATPADRSVQAEVTADGFLTLTIAPKPAKDMRVAWIVDTKAENQVPVA